MSLGRVYKIGQRFKGTMRSIDFDELMFRFSREARSAPKLVRAMVELTYGCNLRCVHCYNPTHKAKNERTTEEFCRILDQLAAQGCLWVGFTGGELFTRRDAFEIMGYAKQLGMVLNILTNATLVTPDLADQIKLLEPYVFQVSVYGATAETYERVTRVPGSFTKFVRGVDLLVEREVPLQLNLVLMSLNIHEHEAMKEFAATRNLRYQVNTDIHPRVDGSLEPLAYRLSPQQAFEIWRQESGEKLRRNDGEESVGSDSERETHEQEGCGQAGGVFHCPCGRSNAAITPYGKLNLCLSIYHPQYDLMEGSVAEGWPELVDLVATAQPEPSYECHQCPLARDQLCTRGTGDSWLEQGVFDAACIPYYEEVAQRKAKFLGMDPKI